MNCFSNLDVDIGDFHLSGLLRKVMPIKETVFSKSFKPIRSRAGCGHRILSCYSYECLDAWVNGVGVLLKSYKMVFVTTRLTLINARCA